MHTQPLRSTTLWVVLGVALTGSGAAVGQVALIDPPDRVARLSYVEGAVSLAPAAANQWVDAAINRPLTGGDRVRVDAASRAELQVDAATIHLDQNTSLSFVALDDDAIRMRLTDGAVVIHVRSLGAHEAITVETNNAIVALHQPGEYAIATDESGQTIVTTRRGECDVSGATPQSYLVGANEQGVFTGDPLQADWVPPPPRNAFEIWSNVREDRASRSVGARYVAAGTIGYQDLDAYGSWSHEPEYGEVWRPTVIAVRDWAPYRYGRWVWVSPWGWTWIDDAPWGFAPFHYGRWAYLRQHWCWVPGPPRARAIYAPALVAWAGDPGRRFDNVGWFPLGPRDFYLPGYQASWRHFRAVNAANVGRFDDAALANAYQGRGTVFDYRNRSAPNALTVVSHDAFVSGHRTRGSGVRVDPNLTRRFQEQGRAPDIQPSRLSVLGAEPARRQPLVHQDHDLRNGGWSDSKATLTPVPVVAVPRPNGERAALVPGVEPAAPQRDAQRGAARARAWAPRAIAPAAEPADPERRANASIGYAKARKQTAVPAIDAVTPAPALPAPALADPGVREQMRGPAAGSRAWVATPSADGQVPAVTPHGSGRAERETHDPGDRRPGFRVTPRGPDASPRDLTR